ncbi:MAG: 2'-5' RNA ligase family protein [Sphingomicrobium sp.]
MIGALIVTADFLPADLAALDKLRRAHFPPERNLLPAHLTLFHALPPSAEAELKRHLARLAAEAAPVAMLDPPYSLGQGVAFRVRSAALDAIRADLADHFHGSLTAQDAAAWRAHVTIQNKVKPADAQALLADLLRDFRPRPLGIAALALHRYLGGPWQRLGRFPFRGA